VSIDAPLELISRTAALAMTAPEGSVTTPFRLPVGACACKAPAWEQQEQAYEQDQQHISNGLKTH